MFRGIAFPGAFGAADEAADLLTPREEEDFGLWVTGAIVRGDEDESVELVVFGLVGEPSGKGSAGGGGDDDDFLAEFGGDLVRFVGVIEPSVDGGGGHGRAGAAVAGEAGVEEVGAEGLGDVVAEGGGFLASGTKAMHVEDNVFGGGGIGGVGPDDGSFGVGDDVGEGGFARGDVGGEFGGGIGEGDGVDGGVDGNAGAEEEDGEKNKGDDSER